MTDPAEKYADRVDPEHRVAIDMTISAYHTLKLVAPLLERLDRAERESHSVEPFIDPTLYRDQINSKSFARQMKIVRAALTFVGVLDALALEATE